MYVELALVTSVTCQETLDMQTNVIWKGRFMCQDCVVCVGETQMTSKESKEG